MRFGTDKQPFTNLVTTKDTVWGRLKRGVDTRIRFVESHLAKNLAFQIRALRDREDWSQEQLAEKVGMNQNAISRLENPSYGKATLTTLKRLAAVFDVALVVRFVPYGQLVDWVSSTPRIDPGLSDTSLRVPSFSDELSAEESALPQKNTETPQRVVSIDKPREVDVLKGKGQSRPAQVQIDSNAEQKEGEKAYEAVSGSSR